MKLPLRYNTEPTDFLIEIFIEIIVNSNAVVRNNTEWSLNHFSQFHLMVILWNTYSRYHNKDIDLDIIHTIYQIDSDFLNFTCTHMCVFISITFNPTCRFMYLPPQSRYRPDPSPQGPLLSSLLPPPLFLTSGSHYS